MNDLSDRELIERARDLRHGDTTGLSKLLASRLALANQRLEEQTLRKAELFLECTNRGERITTALVLLDGADKFFKSFTGKCENLHPKLIEWCDDWLITYVRMKEGKDG